MALAIKRVALQKFEDHDSLTATLPLNQASSLPMSNAFLRLPSEIRIQIYGSLIHDGVPRIPLYACLRIVCRQIMDEFDHEILPVLRAHHEAQLATFLGPKDLVRFSNPQTFEDSRILRMTVSSTWLEQYFLSKTFSHYKGMQRLRMFFDSLSPHIREVEIYIYFGEAGVRRGIDTFSVFGLFDTLHALGRWEDDASGNKRFIRPNVDFIDLFWKNGTSGADCHEIGDFMDNRGYNTLSSLWHWEDKDGERVWCGRRLMNGQRRQNP